MGNFKDRTGEENINKQGLKMKIIKYRSRRDIDVEFDDGTIFYNKNYSSFSSGSLINTEYIKKSRLHKTNINCQNLLMEIIKYNSASNIDVRFDDGTIIYNRQYTSFLNGSILNPNFNNSRTVNRCGETNLMKCGEKCKIINYRTAKDIDVLFVNTGEVMKGVMYQTFKNGELKSRFTPSVYSVGVVGNTPIVDKNGSVKLSYIKWNGMLARSYDENVKEKQPTYRDVTCCKEWLYYPNFKKWFDNNYYEIKGEQMCLDKDILIKGNKIYSPESCIFVSPTNKFIIRKIK